MPVVIIKPPCGRCGRTDLPVWWAMTPPLCDACHAAWLEEQAHRIADAALAAARDSLKTPASSRTAP